MAISFVAAGTVGTGTNPNATVPAGIQKDDLLLIVTAGSATPTTPTGWTQLAAQGAGQFITVLFKFATASESTVNLTQSGTSSKAVMVAYRGAGGVEVRPAFATGTSTTATPNTLTTTYANDYVISLYACALNTTTFTPNASTTSRVNSAATASIRGLLIADELQAAAGTSTARAATLSTTRSWSAFAIGIIEAPRVLYWVGGNGTWDASTTTRWSNTSGGAGGVVAPTLVDDAIINASSGSPTVTLSGSPSCKSLTTTGATCTIDSTGALSINGAMTLSSTTTWTASGNLNFLGTGTITTNAVSIASGITLNGPSQTFTLGDTLNTSTTFTLTAGTLALGTNSLNANAFSTSNSNTRSISFGSGSAINLSAGGTAVTIWQGSTATGFSTSGTPTVNLTYTGGTSTRTISHATSSDTETNSRVDFIVAAGATDTIEIGNSSAFRTLDLQFSGTFVMPGSLTLYGSFNIASSATFDGSPLYDITFSSTSSGNTVNTNGLTTICNMTFDGVGGSWSLSSNINLGSGSNVTVTNGTFSTNNYNITAQVFNSNLSGTRTVNLGSSTITLSSSGTPWNTATTTNLTFNAGTSQINLTSTGSPTFAGGGLTYYNLNFVSSADLTISGSNTFNTLSCSTTSGTATALTLTAGTTQTVTNFNVDGSSANSYVTIESTSTSSAATLSKSSGTVSLSNARIVAVAATGGATWNAFGCQKRSALATGWNFGSFDRYLVINASLVINFTTTGYWSTTSGGATTAQPPYIFDTAILDNGAAGGVTINMVGTIGTLNVTDTFPTDSITAILNQTSSTTFSIYGSCRIPLNTVWGFSGSFTYSFESTSSGNTIDMRTDPTDVETGAFNGTSDVVFNGVGGEWTLLSNFGAATNQQIDVLTFLNGTLNTNSYQINCNTLSSTGTNTAATLNLSASTVTCNTALTVNSSTTTLNAGTSTVIINRSGSSTFTFNSNKTWNIVQIGTTTGTGAITFSSSPTISKLSNLRTGAYTLTITASTTLTVGTFDVRGTAGNVITVASSSSTNATLASQSSAIQSNIDYLTLNFITATPAVSATGATPYYWYVGTNSTKNSSTTGVIGLDGSWRAYQLTSGTSWNVPADWSNSTNNVYLVGGGGGGSGSVVASSTGSHNSGSGGGGGGFTALTNVSLTPSGTAVYAIGAAGAAGAGSTSSSTGGNGGTTTFLVTNTAGGGGGAATGLGTRTAGAAGTGSTYNGGTGGLGTAPGTNTSNAGGGGAGSGGLDGAGVDGGANTGTTIGSGGAGNNNVNDFLFISNLQYGDGGNGGATNAAGVVATGFGGGGGGGGTTSGSATTRAGALGTQGTILIRYQLAAVNNGNFLTFFYQ